MVSLYLLSPKYIIQLRLTQIGPLQYFFGLNLSLVVSNEAHRYLFSSPNFSIRVSINFFDKELSGAPQKSGENDEDDINEIFSLFLRS